MRRWLDILVLAGQVAILSICLFGLIWLALAAGQGWEPGGYHRTSPAWPAAAAGPEGQP